MRIERQTSNALELAKWLDSNSQVTSVNFPGLESDPYYSRAKKYTTGRGMGCMLMFSLNGGYENAVKFIDSDESKSLTKGTNLPNGSIINFYLKNYNKKKILSYSAIIIGIIFPL